MLSQIVHRYGAGGTVTDHLMHCVLCPAQVCRLCGIPLDYPFPPSLGRRLTPPEFARACVTHIRAELCSPRL